LHYKPISAPKSKNMNFPAFIVNKIAFSSGQSFSRFIIKIAIAAVALSMTVMIIATSLINGFQETISRKVFGFWAHIIVTPYRSADSLEDYPVSKSASIYSNPGMYKDVKHVQATALKGGILHAENDFDGIILKGVGKDFDWTSFKEYLVEGVIFEATEEDDNQSILISEATSKRLFIHVNDRIVMSFFDEKSRVRKRIFFVSGIYNSGIKEFDQQYALADIAVIQNLNNWGKDSVGGFEVFVDEKKLFNPKLKTYFATVFGGLLPESVRSSMLQQPLDRVGDDIFYSIEQDLYAQTIREFRPEIFNWLELQTMNEIVILFIMLLVAAFNMITALLILILERTEMIGILKALGSHNKQIRNIFIINGSIIIATGLLIGNILGISICMIQDYTQFFKLPPDSYYISYAPVKIDWLWILLLNIFTLIISTLFLLLPTILVSKISPVKAIRFE
jgi:lipoprotein-releasing system permease protein